MGTMSPHCGTKAGRDAGLGLVGMGGHWVWGLGRPTEGTAGLGGQPRSAFSKGEAWRWALHPCLQQQPHGDRGEEAHPQPCNPSSFLCETAALPEPISSPSPRPGMRWLCQGCKNNPARLGTPASSSLQTQLPKFPMGLRWAPYGHGLLPGAVWCLAALAGGLSSFFFFNFLIFLFYNMLY